MDIISFLGRFENFRIRICFLVLRKYGAPLLLLLLLLFIPLFIYIYV